MFQHNNVAYESKAWQLQWYMHKYTHMASYTLVLFVSSIK